MKKQQQWNSQLLVHVYNFVYNHLFLYTSEIMDNYIYPISDGEMNDEDCMLYIKGKTHIYSDYMYNFES